MKSKNNNNVEILDTDICPRYSGVIIDSVKIITSLKVENVNTAQDYKAKNISDKVVKIIYSYVHYVNRNVWKKF